MSAERGEADYATFSIMTKAERTAIDLEE